MRAAVTLTMLALGAAGMAEAQAPPAFEARYIAAISDADMRAYAYIDGELGAPRGVDELAIVTTPLERTTPTGTVEVSNSVINPVFGIAASPDGDTVFVVETRLPRDEGDTTMNDLEFGTTLRAVDVRDPAAPVVIGATEVGLAPQGVSVSADGRTLAIATKAPEAPLVFVPWNGTEFGEVQALPLDMFSPLPEFPDQGRLPHHVEWHPTADIVAVVMNFRAQVQFFQVERDENGVVAAVTPWGNRLFTSKWAMSGKFSPDGRFFVTNDLQWGTDVRGIYVNAPPSQLTVIELAALDTAEPRHFVVGGVSLPRHAESLAFANDGSLIATVNIGQTWIARGETGHSRSSLSLVDFDTATGQPRHLGDWSFDGVLPEGVAFDGADRHLVVGVFEYEGPEPRRSALEFWRVDRTGAEPALAPTGFAVETGPGAHSLIVVN